MNSPAAIPGCPGPLEPIRRKIRRRRRPATPMAMCSGRRTVSLCGGSQLHAARRAAGKVPRACSTRSASSAACWCRAARTAATIPRCSTRWRATRTGCAASRSPTRPCRPPSCAVGRARHPRAALQSFLPRRPVALPRRRHAGEREEARAGDEGSRLALQLWIDVQGPAGDDPDPEGDRPAGGDRPHGPHRCARRHRHAGASRACCATSARAAAG